MVCEYWVDVIFVFSVIKVCFLVSLVFLMEKMNYIIVFYVLVYFGVVIFFVYFKFFVFLFGIYDFFVLFENLFCVVFMGGMWDVMRRVVVIEFKKEEKDVDILVVKFREDKKNDWRIGRGRRTRISCCEVEEIFFFFLRFFLFLIVCLYLFKSLCIV